VARATAATRLQAGEADAPRVAKPASEHLAPAAAVATGVNKRRTNKEKKQSAIYLFIF
jgi:hypothetical protein